ncbi:hypothetical protein CAOG_04641 [Capsaspora owczarzaki ATCC 30864]|uniref:TLC domain-containing protein n=1 Tax=Capsaspora owczarzaki (strain ATCC 30864) TaxID=595528 RepID=A0A0D2X396_CAPO3|nr:hypothetical protein CAOG_04641 [Capsaspora owczarzaki ATCC 30864]KJE93924.1 hypothetical protein CAOG_004641 [Capsaspora owczarzaki ATCC 30864]|eukprot:XP_004347388.2 hypothetical protein CAOG_04641 [Capsaspora owczarzaki ATCC 30864]
MSCPSMLAECNSTLQQCSEGLFQCKDAFPTSTTLSWFSTANILIIIILVATERCVHALFRRFSFRYRLLTPSHQHNTCAYQLQIIYTTVCLLLSLIYGVPLILDNQNPHIDVHTLEMCRLNLAILAFLYAYELSYRPQMGLQLAVHHVCTILLCILAVRNYEDERQPVAIAMTISLGFTANTEQLTFVALTWFRLRLKGSNLLFKIAAIQTLVFKIFFTGLTLGLWGKYLAPQDATWWLVLRPLVPILISILFVTQVYGAFILWKLSFRERAMTIEEVFKAAKKKPGLGLHRLDASGGIAPSWPRVSLRQSMREVVERRSSSAPNMSDSSATGTTPMTQRLASDSKLVTKQYVLSHQKKGGSQVVLQNLPPPAGVSQPAEREGASSSKQTKGKAKSSDKGGALGGATSEAHLMSSSADHDDHDDHDGAGVEPTAQDNLQKSTLAASQMSLSSAGSEHTVRASFTSAEQGRASASSFQKAVVPVKRPKSVTLNLPPPDPNEDEGTDRIAFRSDGVVVRGGSNEGYGTVRGMFLPSELAWSDHNELIRVSSSTSSTSASELLAAHRSPDDDEEDVDLEAADMLQMDEISKPSFG